TVNPLSTFRGEFHPRPRPASRLSSLLTREGIKQTGQLDGLRARTKGTAWIPAEAAAGIHAVPLIACEAVRSRSRVRGLGRPSPLPSELHGRVPTHAAQALVNALGTARGSPIGLEAHLDVTAWEPANGTVGSCTGKGVAPRQHFCLARSSRLAHRSRPPTP